ncbi:MAG: hypothetical protein R3F20_13580 [Planctomycetota bacterium]
MVTPLRDAAFLALAGSDPERAAALIARHPRRPGSEQARALAAEGVEALLHAELDGLDPRRARGLPDSRLAHFLRRRALRPGRIPLALSQRLPTAVRRLVDLDETSRAAFERELGATLAARLVFMAPPERRVDLLRPLGTALARDVAERLDGEAARMIVSPIPLGFMRDLRAHWDAAARDREREPLLRALGRRLIALALIDLEPGDRRRVDDLARGGRLPDLPSDAVPEAEFAPLARRILDETSGDRS